MSSVAFPAFCLPSSLACLCSYGIRSGDFIFFFLFFFFAALSLRHGWGCGRGCESSHVSHQQPRSGQIAASPWLAQSELVRLLVILTIVPSSTGGRLWVLIRVAGLSRTQRLSCSCFRTFQLLYSSFLVLILITWMLFLGTCASTLLAAVSA